MTTLKLSTRWAVHAQTSVALDASSAQVWQVMQRFSRFIAADPYHTRMTHAQGKRLDVLPPRGTALRIGHGIGFTWFYRVGTLIRAVPQQSLAFTDLSQRGRAVGFPHVYQYQLKPINENTCQLKLVVRGRWSARWLPRPIVYAWLWWVMAQAHWSLSMHIPYEIGRLQQLGKLNDPAPTRKEVSL